MSNVWQFVFTFKHLNCPLFLKDKFDIFYRIQHGTQINFLVLFIGEHLMDFGGRLLPCQRLGK